MTADGHDHGWRGRWPGRVLRFPLTRIVLGFLAIIVVGNLARVLGGVLYEGLGLGPWRVTSLARAVIVVGAAHFAYLGYVRCVEQRPAAELSWSGASRELGRGALIGAGLLAGTVVALAAIGFYRVEAVNPWTVLIPAFAIAVQAAWVEELLYRGVLLRILDEGLGT